MAGKRTPRKNQKNRKHQTTTRIRAKKPQPKPKKARVRFALVDSSAIVSALYFDHLSELCIEFTNGRTYYYQDVPLDVYYELAEAESAGKYFNANIRGKYEYNEEKAA